MTIVYKNWQTDANQVPILTDGALVSKRIVYDGGVGTGAQGTTNIFTITGLVNASFVLHCTSDLISVGGTLSLGHSINTASLIALTTASTIDANTSFSGASFGAVYNFNENQIFKIIDANVIETIATADITGGTVTYYCIYNPISSNGNVQPA